MANAARIAAKRLLRDFAFGPMTEVLGPYRERETLDLRFAA